MDYKFYNFNDIILEQDRKNVCNDVKSLIEAGRFWQNSPKYQTNLNVFGLNGEHWMKLKMSFILSAFMFLRKEVQIKNIQAWSFQTSLKYQEDRESLWHHHLHDTSVNSVSGIYYVHLPVEEDICGTEFAPKGPKNKERLQLPPKVGHWLIYNSKEWHRPGELKSEDNRYIVAADLQF